MAGTKGSRAQKAAFVLLPFARPFVLQNDPRKVFAERCRPTRLLWMRGMSL